MNCKHCDGTNVKTTDVRHSEMIGATYTESHISSEITCSDCGGVSLSCASTVCKFSKYSK